MLMYGKEASNRKQDRKSVGRERVSYEVSVPDEALTDEDEDILNYDDLDDMDAFV